MDTVPFVDLGSWSKGSGAERARLAGEVDRALCGSGFLLLTGHGVPRGLGAEVRRLARTFFALPEHVKARYQVPIGGYGWIRRGAEVSAMAEGMVTEPDLVESFVMHVDDPTGDNLVDKEWFAPNAFPVEVPGLERLAREYLATMGALAGELMSLCAMALGQAADCFAPYLTRHTSELHLRWYSSISQVGPPLPNQFRTGPHTDWGTVTILDRERGVGGLQLYLDGEWVRAPYDPDAYTINVGDMLSHWTGGRWRSTRHRVLPPHPSAPDEELLSLSFFHQPDPDAVIHPLGPPIGRVSYPPTNWADFYHGKIRSITA